jgi:hypothetical protein
MSEEEFKDHVNFVMQKKHFLMPEGFASLDEKFDFDIYV